MQTKAQLQYLLEERDADVDDADDLVDLMLAPIMSVGPTAKNVSFSTRHNLRKN